MVQVLQRMTYGDGTLRKTLQGQGRVLLFNYWLTYSVLKAMKPRFQPLLPPSEAELAAAAGSPESEPPLDAKPAASTGASAPVLAGEGIGGGGGNGG